MRITGVGLAAVLVASTATAQQRPWSLTPAGFGPVQIGMTRAQVSSALGAPLQGEALNDANACIEMDSPRSYPGVYFMFVNRRLGRVSVTQPSRVTTRRGIGVGATDAQIRRAYPIGLQQEAHQYSRPPARYLTYWSRPNTRGVRFETDERRRVVTIHAGTDSINYVEGCA